MKEHDGRYGRGRISYVTAARGETTSESGLSRYPGPATATHGPALFCCEGNRLQSKRQDAYLILRFFAFNPRCTLHVVVFFPDGNEISNLFWTRSTLPHESGNAPLVFSKPITIVYSRRKSCFPSSLYSTMITGSKMDLQVQIQLNLVRMCRGYGLALGKLD